MFIKRVSPRGWHEQMAIENGVNLVKLSGRGLRGYDLRDFLKTASRDFLPYLESVKMAPGEVPVHMVALGDTEFWGPNSNGDGFKEATNKIACKTFEKLARWYRGHKNKDKSKSYGVIKKALHNDEMHRVELLVGLNGTKEAAERNGGLVADKELDALYRGEDIPVSMAAGIDYDECSGCHNKARTRAEYCREDRCKYGGCAENMGKVMHDGHVLHVDNVNPRFFDISNVGTPADRTAYATAADYAKAASLLETLTTEGTVPDNVLEAMTSRDQLARIRLVEKLATLEKDLELNENDRRIALVGASAELDSHVLPLLAGSDEKQARANLLGLAQSGIILNLQAYAAVTGRQPEYKQAAAGLGRVYRRILDTDLIAWSTQSALDCGDCRMTKSAAIVSDTLRESFGYREMDVMRRAMLGSLRPATPVFEYSNGAVTKLAADYAAYQTAALLEMLKFDPHYPLTVSRVLGQNRVYSLI